MGTLYKDSKTGIFKEKPSKIILRQLTRNKIFSVDTYQGVGLFNLRLDELATELAFESIKSTSKQLPLMYMKDSRLNVVITVSPLKKAARRFDDNESIASNNSDASTIGATFSFDSDSVFDSEMPFEFNNSANIDKLRHSAGTDDSESSPSFHGGRLSRRNSKSIETPLEDNPKPPNYSNYKKDAPPAAPAAPTTPASPSPQAAVVAVNSESSLTANLKKSLKALTGSSSSSSSNNNNNTSTHSIPSSSSRSPLRPAPPTSEEVKDISAKEVQKCNSNSQFIHPILPILVLFSVKYSIDYYCILLTLPSMSSHSPAARGANQGERRDLQTLPTRTGEPRPSNQAPRDAAVHPVRPDLGPQKGRGTPQKRLPGQPYLNLHGLFTSISAEGTIYFEFKCNFQCIVVQLSVARVVVLGACGGPEEGEGGAGYGGRRAQQDGG